MRKNLASKHIDIVTSQNVVISYELASLGNRIVSNFIDICAVTAVNILVRIIADLTMSPEMVFFSGSFSLWFYHLVFVIFFRGNTLGMRAMGIRLMKPGGGNVEFADLFLRWIVRPLDITLTLGALGIFLMLGSEKRQRLGDMLAGTVMVRKKHDVHFTLNDILAFHENAVNSQVQFPGVRHMSEKDMLLIKNLLYNQAGYDRKVFDTAIVDCSFKMAELLQLERVPDDRREFLQTLVNDYIILTR